MNTVKILLLFLLCNAGYSQTGFFKEIEASQEPELKNVFRDVEKYEVQILYSSVDRKPGGAISFENTHYRLDDGTYFYPASTVKLPVAILALEKLNELKNSGFQIEKTTEYHFPGDSISHSIAEDIKAIFAVSDNDAYNRLFEFLGQDYINEKLRKKGLKPVRISHRFSGDTSLDTLTRQMIFQLEASKSFHLPVTHNRRAIPLELKSIEKGKAYMENGAIQKGAFSFRLKNYFPLSVQHQLMKQLFFPEKFNKKQRFNLDKEDREFLFTAMSVYPRQAGYNKNDYQDSYSKFFIFGDSEEPISSGIKIYNKVGYAYGTLTETAYIHDPGNDVEFILSATILVNENRVFNDNIYEFDNIGVPFLAELGRQIYNYELKRRNNN